MLKPYKLVGLWILLFASKNILKAQSITTTITPVVAGCNLDFSTSLSGAYYYWDFGADASVRFDTANWQQSFQVYFRDSGTYMVRLAVVTGCCAWVYDSLSVHVEPSALAISLTTVPDTICQGAPISLRASPGSNYRYQFYVDSQYLQTSLVDSLTATQLKPGDSVSVIAYNGSCYTNQVYAYPVVHPTPPVPVLSALPSNDTICAFDTITFMASSGYESYIFSNGSSEQQSGPETWVTNTLFQGNTVTVTGAVYGCYSGPSNPVVFTVKARPFLADYLFPNPVCKDTLAIDSVDGIADIYSFYIDSVLVQSGGSSKYSTDSLHNGSVVTVIGESNGCFSFADSITYVVENCTGISGPNAGSLQLYPNPVNGQLIIDGADDINAITGAGVYDVIGQQMPVIYEHDGDRLLLNTQALLPGVYVLRLSIAGKTWCDKFVKE